MKKQDKQPQPAQHTHHSAHSERKHNPMEKKASPAPKWLPYVIAPLLFLFVTFIFFKPMWLDNKVLNQSDIVHFKGVAKECNDYRAKTGKEALWTGSMFSGMPAFQVSTLYNGNLTRYVHDVLTLYLPHPSELLFLAMVNFFILLVLMGINPWLSIAGAFAFGLSSYDFVILNAGHNSKMGAMAYMPLVIAGVMLLFNRKYLWGIILFSIALALEIRSNHLQVTYYLAIVVGIYFIVEAIYAFREKQLKHYGMVLALSLVGGAFAVAANTSLLWCTISYTNQTIRGKSDLTTNTQSSGGLDKDYAFDWSYGKMETMTLLIPDFYGGSSTSKLGESSNAAKALQEHGVDPNNTAQFLSQAPTFWGPEMFTSGPVYLGAVVCFLFVLGLILVRGKLKWWLLAASVVGIMLAWGKNLEWFSNIFFYYVPGYNKFRTVEMILIIPQLTFALMALLVLNDITNRKISKEEIIRGLKIAGGITAGACLFFAVLGSSLFSFAGNDDKNFHDYDWLRVALVADRQSMMRSDALRSFIFIALAAALIWLFVTDKIKQLLFTAGFILLIALDLMLVGTRYLDSKDFISKSEYDQYFVESPVDEQILRDPDLDYRVLNEAGNTFNDSHTSYFHKSIGGYSAVKLRRYQELIENQISKNNGDVLDMLNTRYVIVSKGRNEGEAAQANPSACGNAWFVDSVRVVENADEEMNRIGYMSTITALGNTPITVNGKKVTSANIGNHDNIKIDTISVDAASFYLPMGFADTMGTGLVMGKDSVSHIRVKDKRQGASSNLFVVTRNYRFNPRKYAIMDKAFAAKEGDLKIQPDSTRHIQLQSYEPNHLIYKSTSAKDGFVVFSEIYYPEGWKCTVDDKPVDIVRVDYVLRGMKLPAGNHTIDFKFEPASFYTGEKISLASSGLLLLLLIGLGLKDFVVKKKRKKERLHKSGLSY